MIKSSENPDTSEVVATAVEREPEKAAGKAGVFENLHSDSDFHKLHEDLTKKVNEDAQVRVALRGGKQFQYGDAWERVFNREYFFALEYFAKDHNEKASQYAKKWQEFTSEHPEVSQLNNVEWDRWGNKNPNGFAVMTEYRDIARAVERVREREAANHAEELLIADTKKIEDIGNKLGISKTLENTASLREREDQKVRLQMELTQRIIESGMPKELREADDEKLFEEQKRLDALPYIGGEAVKDLVGAEGDDRGLQFVRTEKIIGSASPAYKDWSSEYESRKGRVVEIAKSLRHGSEENIENVFHLKKVSEQVKMKEIEAPEGSVYVVLDGTHRIASTKLLNMPEVPARIESMGKVKDSYTEDAFLAEEWQERIKRGLIQGSVEQIDISGVRAYKLTIESQKLPWMHLSTAKLLQMSRIYESLYPNALERTGIPAKALTDRIGYQAYMAGRFDEFETSQSKKDE